MAGEVRAESPAPVAAPPLPVHEKRAGSEDGGEEEERPEPKRRRACVAALDSVPCAVAADGEGAGDEHRDGASFSFQHARGGFVALETTPKFGSFNPPAAAEQVATEPKPAPPAGEDSPQVEEEEKDASSDRSDGEDKDKNSQLALGVGVQGQT